MVRTGLRLAACRLRGRYPVAVLVAQFQIAHLVTFGGIAFLTLYEDLSSSDFWLIVAVSQLFMFGENLFATKISLRMLRPVRAWLNGDRSEEATMAAWLHAAALPSHYLSRFRWLPIVFNLFPVCVFIVWQLELPVYSLAALMAGGVVVVLYGETLRYFAIELAMRPILEQISPHLPDHFVIGRPGVSLRMKLLAVLPMINIITGVIVSGLSSDGTRGLGELGLDVLLAVLVAFTISLELTLLLSASILAPLNDLQAATERIRAGDLKARVPVTSTDEAGALAQSFNDMVVRLEERERLREAFGAFVDPGLAETVLRDGTLEGDEVEVSVIFIDIRGFTAFAEQASAREVVTRLNDFYELVVPILLRHGGHANKFVGDGLLGVFGAPERLEDHADRAVAAALEISSCVREHYGDSLKIGIGVNSGPVMAGTVGGGGRLDFTVIGDPVNTAARVEEVTRETGDGVLITEATRCLLTGEEFRFEERPAAALKGKAERVALYAPVPAGERQPEVVAGEERARESLAAERART